MKILNNGSDSYSSPARNKIDFSPPEPNAGFKSSNTGDCNADEITFKIVGDFGNWQFWISFSMALLKLPIAWYQLNIIFMAPPQEFWCAKPKSFIKYTEEEWRDVCAPKIEEHPCLIFDPDILLIEPDMDRSLIPLVTCPQFVYDATVFSRTIISDWNLVCSKHWYIHLTQCIMMWGVLLGSIIFGIIADKYGRKTPLMIGITMQCIMSYITSVLPSYAIFLVCWFILAIASGGIGIISFVISMEVVGGKWRTIIPILYQLPFGLGNTVMAILAYWLRDWRKLEFALATLSSFYMFYWVFIPESPKWLIATAQNEKALEVLHKAAQQNNREQYFEENKDSLQKCKKQVRDDPGFMTFMKSESMRLKTMLLSINWFCTGLAFFSFSQYLGFIGGNIFLTVAISGIISVSGGLICLYIVTRVGRKTTVWIFQIITAFCFVFIFCIPKDVFANDWPRLLFAGLGFAGLSGTVPALYLFSGELFPTIGRNSGVAGVTTFARIAAMVAPAVVSLDELMPDLPLALLAVMSFGQLALLGPLPETKDQPLPDTLAEAEQFNKRKSRTRHETSKERIKDIMMQKFYSYTSD
ncbi:organic cation transporter protein-like isoform X1 [Maniola jurtina]|uniref:organic cation transporter protein-like isoform X1 n=1 Tax=Maniola jurtina TaxID=191418 RepID=UPI001E68ED60|nr:organic cation transporter protein-like isoform X1 [Maniola jurtina]